MRIYWTTTTEMAKEEPEIFAYNLKSQGMFIGVPGTLIFRTRREAEQSVKAAKAAIEANLAQEQKDNE